MADLNSKLLEEECQAQVERSEQWEAEWGVLTSEAQEAKQAHGEAKDAHTEAKIKLSEAEAKLLEAE